MAKKRKRQSGKTSRSAGRDSRGSRGGRGNKTAELAFPDTSMSAPENPSSSGSISSQDPAPPASGSNPSTSSASSVLSASSHGKPAKTSFIDPFKNFDKVQKKRKSSARESLTTTQKKKLLTYYLEKSGSPWLEDEVKKNIKFICIFITVAFSLYWILQIILGKINFLGLLVFIVLTCTAGFAVLWFLCWGVIYLYLDFRMYQRKKEIEEILPDFLQLVSSNISAGMPIDRALWFAIRPKFGVLAKEMEIVAKSTLTGEDLKQALIDFSDKYNSVLLKRSINLINEGLDAGGQMAELLNKIALNFEEIKTMRKDMSSSVTTYVIFISFATVAAAPMLFALATELLTIIQTLTSSLDLSSSSSFFTISSDSIKMKDFRIFAYTMLLISSTLSAMLVSTISKGNIKDGLKYIPIFIICTLSIYGAGSWLLHVFFGGIFASLG